MTDKTEVNLTGAKDNKGVWLVKVRRDNELLMEPHMTLIDAPAKTDRLTKF